MSLVDWFHGEFIFGRRVQRLSSILSSVLPKNAKVLDIGAGDGSLDKLILAHRPDVSISGLDVLIRPETAIPVREFDGVNIPYESQSWDVAMFVDVIHHASEPRKLLNEAARVARSVVIKDHIDEGLLSNQTLRLMDYVGNARHGVALPYDYWKRSQWNEAFQEMGVAPAQWNDKLALYPFPLSAIFDRSLHFIARLDRAPVL